MGTWAAQRRSGKHVAASSVHASNSKPERNTFNGSTPQPRILAKPTSPNPHHPPARPYQSRTTRAPLSTQLAYTFLHLSSAAAEATDDIAFVVATRTFTTRLTIITDSQQVCRHYLLAFKLLKSIRDQPTITIAWNPRDASLSAGMKQRSCPRSLPGVPYRAS
ncbi:hypothetical protein HPB48_004946 [Haemaphysalis longicornis]|uniref:Uncharacterized protein n=1 Tax=Haemaphysalis longicornis TaxID=44386 RepID=A0A9J6GEG8_HAELO|nr:hypothetical protein HPB48_004946 [Haemaphysalis longicornis]